MRGLLLVDLDNVLRGLAGPNALETFTRRVSARLEAAGGRCSVVFGLNTDTALRNEMTFEGLREAGRALGEAAGDSEARVEVGIALTMPQTADVLLARLAREAPAEASSGPYSRAVVFTDDRGLAEALGDELFERDRRHPWIKLRTDRWLGTEWQMPEGGKPIVRKPPPSPRARQQDAVLPMGGYTICITPGREAWAARRPMDADASLELMHLAAELDECPWLLSQVGPTQTTLRGIERIAGLPCARRPTLGAIAPKDGVEIRGGAAAPTSGQDPENASVGIGAVRFVGSDATVASRLPVSVLRSASAAYPLDRRGVNVRAALQQLPTDTVLGDKTVKVRLWRTRSDLVAKVEHSSTSQPQAWWLLGETAAKSELRLPHPELLPSSIVVTAAPIRPSANFASRFALSSPVAAGDDVRVRGGIAAGTIGVGLTQPAFGKARPIAIYSPSRPLQDGNIVRVAPIQLVPRSGPLWQAPTDLWSLPLVVPQ